MANKSKALTVNDLGKILYEEFARDSWGTIDPWYFQDPPKQSDGSDYDGLYEVLARVVARLNGESNG